MLIISLFLFSLSLQASYEIHFDTKSSLFGAGEMSVPCEMGNNEDLCKIDTGANISSFSKKSHILKDVARKVITSTTYTTITGATKSCDFVTVNNLFLNQYQLNELHPVICDTAEGETPRNIIGLDAFRDQSIYIDTKQKKIIVGYLPPQDQKLKSFEVDSVGHILLPVKLTNGVETTAMFDTGSAFNLVSNKFLEENSNKFRVIDTTKISEDTFGNPIEMKKTIANLKIEDEVFVSEYFMGTDFSAVHKNAGKNVNYIIGFSIISQNNWFFDLKNKKWYVE